MTLTHAPKFGEETARPSASSGDSESCVPLRSPSRFGVLQAVAVYRAVCCIWSWTSVHRVWCWMCCHRTSACCALGKQAQPFTGWDPFDSDASAGGLGVDASARDGLAGGLAAPGSAMGFGPGSPNALVKVPAGLTALHLGKSGPPPRSLRRCFPALTDFDLGSWSGDWVSLHRLSSSLPRLILSNCPSPSLLALLSRFATRVGSRAGGGVPFSIPLRFDSVVFPTGIDRVPLFSKEVHYA